jgi:hypothetical protein
MILVEGPDGAGKTTLVERLAQMYGLQIGHRGTDNRDLLWTVTLPDTLRALSDAVHGVKPPAIWDRLYYSDFVYAPLGATPRPVAFNESQQKHIDAVIEALRCPIIVCLPPFRVVERNIMSERHQMEGVKERALNIWDEYYRMTYKVGDAQKAFPDHRVVYNYEDDLDCWEDVLNEIEDYLSERQERMP